MKIKPLELLCSWMGLSNTDIESDYFSDLIDRCKQLGGIHVTLAEQQPISDMHAAIVADPGFYSPDVASKTDPFCHFYEYLLDKNVESALSLDSLADSLQQHYASTSKGTWYFTIDDTNTSSNYKILCVSRENVFQDIVKRYKQLDVV